MMSLGELFATVGYKVDEASIKKYDKLVEDSAAKTKEAAAQADALTKRLTDWARARAEAQAKNVHLLAAIRAVEDRNVTPAINKSLASSVVSLDAARAGQEIAAKKSRDWAATITGIAAGWGLVTQAVGFVQAKLTGVLRDLKQAGGEAGDVLDLSERTGISTDALQEFGYAARQNGSDVQTLAMGWKALANKADSATQGSKAAAKALRDVGVSAKDLKSGKLSLEDAIGKIAGKFAEMEDGPKKAALSMDLFGGAGQRLIPLLNQGEDGLKKFRKEARDLGLVFSKEALGGVDTFDDSSQKLEESLKSLKTRALMAIAPAMNKIIAKFQEWIKGNHEKVVRLLTAAFETMGKAIGVAADVAMAIVEAFDLVADNSDTVVAALTGIGFALLVYRAAAIKTAAVSIAAAVSTAAAWALANWPFIALGLAVAAVVKWWPQIKRGATSAAHAVRDAFYAAGRAVKEGWANVVAFFEDKINWLIDKVMWVGRKLGDAKNAVGDLVTGKSGGGGGGFAGDVMRTMKSKTAGGDAQAASVKAMNVAPSSAPQGGSTTVHASATVMVNGAKDPQATGVEVRKQLDQFWSSKMRTGF